MALIKSSKPSVIIAVGILSVVLTVAFWLGVVALATFVVRWVWTS